jgi:lipoprotein-releasing system permease protein
MKFESFIAKRYLISKHKVNFITIISFLSIAGVAIGVAALIVVISVFNGFSSLVTSFLVNFDPHLKIEYISKAAPGESDPIKIISSQPEYIASSPFITGKVLVLRGDRHEVVNLKGINETEGNSVYGIEKNILFGSYDLFTESEIPEAVIGFNLANKLTAIIGDTLVLVSPAGIEQIVTQFTEPRSARFKIAGIFSSNNNTYDANYIFTSLAGAQNLFNYGDRIQGYDIRLNRIEDSFRLKEKLANQLPADQYRITTWYDFHRDLYSMMQIERWAAFILLSLIIAVASFNILGSLSMSVIEKKRDIGILRSMGAQQNSILKIFMFEGLLIGIIGTFIGVVIGYTICFLQLQYNIYPLDPTQYKINSLPLDVRLSDFFYITGVSLFLSFIASMLPAKRAAKVNPLEAIKWE